MFKRHTEFQTGDLILFSGKPLISGIIKYLTNSEYSHVGIILVCEEHDQSFILESMSEVRITPLYNTIRAYSGRVMVRRLKNPLSDAEKHALFEYAERYRGRPFDYNVIELSNAILLNKTTNKIPASWLDFLKIKLLKNADNFDAFFCSELIAGALDYIGFDMCGMLAGAFTPSEFSTKSSCPTFQNSSSGLYYTEENIK
jgi:hypothetical protein